MQYIVISEWDFLYGKWNFLVKFTMIKKAPSLSQIEQFSNFRGKIVR
jgi:hypothetical protein